MRLGRLAGVVLSAWALVSAAPATGQYGSNPSAPESPPDLPDLFSGVERAGSSPSYRSTATPPAPRAESPPENTLRTRSPATPRMPSSSSQASAPATRQLATDPFPNNLRSPSATRSPTPRTTAPPPPAPTARSERLSSNPPPASTYSPSTRLTTPSGGSYRTATSDARDASVLRDRGGAMNSAAERTTHELLTEMLKPRDLSQLRGVPTSLSSVVATAPSRSDQGQLVEAYWALSSTTADYYLGLTEGIELARLQRNYPVYGQVLERAEQHNATRTATSLTAARAAQMRLARLVGDGVARLPSDVPFTGRYATRMESVFAAGAPEEAAMIDRLLPLRLEELRAAAQAVKDAQDWVPRVANDRGNDTSGRGIVKALELLALNRRAFVMLARDYNLQINRYTQLAAPERVDTPRLVAMLIRTPGGRSFSGDLGGGASAVASEYPLGASSRR